ncbi:MAG: hypothetical protein LBD85_03695, partial [Oscillospiraceae bacterium]|nr:hypothetical protein [Oscillospiraceae bacterium]
CAFAHAASNGLSFLRVALGNSLNERFTNILFAFCLVFAALGMVLFIKSKGAELTPAKRDVTSERYIDP